jgi:hypothetical protein
MLHNPDNTVNHRFSNQDKLGFAKDIAIGVSYLHSLRYLRVLGPNPREFTSFLLRKSPVQNLRDFM